MARIHLTGASGYLGATMREHLMSAGHGVELATYRLPDVEPRSIDADILLHVAAAGGGTLHRRRRGWEDEAGMARVNVDGMRALLAALTKPTARVLFVSSTAVYGKQLPVPRFDESAPTDPVSEYGRNKAAAEAVLAASAADWLVLRPSGVFGPGADGNCGNAFLNVVVARALQQGRIEQYGGAQDIDTVFIDDVVQVVLRACAGEWRSREIYNVAGEIVSVGHMLEVLHKVLADEDVACERVQLPWTPVPGALALTEKLQRDFPGWRPTALPEALRHLVRAHLHGRPAAAD